jgi:hypothetical protein
MSIATAGASEKLTSKLEDARAITPLQTCELLGISMAHLYKHMHEFDTYLDGRSRKITLASIKRRQARLIAQASGKRPRGRPRKNAALAQPQAPVSA